MKFKANQAAHSSYLFSVIHIHNALFNLSILHVHINRGLSIDLRLGRLTIEDFGNFLQRTTLGLWEEEVDGGDHGCESANVDEVELPGNRLKRNGVTELVED